MRTSKNSTDDSHFFWGGKFGPQRGTKRPRGDQKGATREPPGATRGHKSAPRGDMGPHRGHEGPQGDRKESTRREKERKTLKKQGDNTKHTKIM